MNNIFEICVWLSNNSHVLQMANQLCAMKNMSSQNFGNATSSTTSNATSSTSMVLPTMASTSALQAVDKV